MSVYAIIPAGGLGKRFNETLPKQFHQINGKEIIVYTLEIFQNCSLVDEIIVAVHTEYSDLLKEIIQKYKLSKVQKIVNGGIERQDSVYNALSSIQAKPDDHILVHDAARPLVSRDILERAIKEAQNFDNIIVCIKARDTLLKGDEYAASYIDRKDVYYVQTPQIFRYNILKESMELAYRNNFYGTDESMLLRNAGYDVKIIEGSVFNFKITTKEDVDLFSKIINS